MMLTSCAPFCQKCLHHTERMYKNKFCAECSNETYYDRIRLNSNDIIPRRFELYKRGSFKKKRALLNNFNQLSFIF